MTTTTEQDIDICPGPCNRAWEAAERHQHNTGETHQLHPNPGAPIWCHHCRDTITERLLELPKLVNQLGSGNLNTPPADTEVRNPNITTPSPSPAFDLADEAVRWAVTQATHWRNHFNDPHPHKRTTMRTSLAYLHGRLTPILSTDPHGIDFGTTTNNWHYRLTNITGARPLIHRIPGQCLHCDKRGHLRREDGDEIVKCNACGACWDFVQWPFLAHHAAKEKTG